MERKRIRIIFLHWCLVCGGAESALLDLINLLDKEIFDITVFAIYGGGEWTDRFRSAGVTVVDSYSCITPQKTLLGKIKNRIKAKKIWTILNKNTGADLLKVCTPNNYDIIISFHLDPGHIAAGFSNSTKTICYIHGDATTNAELQQQLQTLCETNVVYDKIICVSECAKRGFQKYYTLPANVSVCLNPINSDKIIMKSQDERSVVIQEGYICAIGRLVQVKGFVRLVRMFAAITAETPNTKLVIIGDGPEKAQIQEEITRYHLEDKVLLLGYLANPYPYLSHARFSVCSSYSEGLHIASMESILLGIPVLSIYPTIAELMGNEQCGMVVTSEEDFIYWMKKMCTDDALYAKMKLAAERRSSSFTSKVLTDIVTNEYIDVLTSLSSN